MPTAAAAPLIDFPPPHSNSIFPSSALAAAAAAAFSSLPPMWPCLDCGMKLTSQLHWLEHRRVYHSQPEPLNLSLSKPVIIENEAQTASYRCNDCRKDFTNKSQWQEHMGTYHWSAFGLLNGNGVDEGKLLN